MQQNLINDSFFQFWLSEGLSIGRILSEKKYGGAVLISKKTEALYAELKGTLMQIWKSTNIFASTQKQNAADFTL